MSQESLETIRRLLQNEVEELRERLEHAQEEINVAEAEINLQASVTSSIRRLPPDVLGTIFAYAIPATLLRLSDMASSAPWTLMRICMHWTDVCLLHCSLWSRIYIETTASVVQRPLRDPEAIVSMQQTAPSIQSCILEPSNP